MSTTKLRNRTAVGLIAFGILGLPNSGFATMPALTPRPEPIGLKACQQWALDQDEDAKWMWGVQETGFRSIGIGTARLVLECMGDKKPEIVGFGSSAGFDLDYCEKHAGTPICQQESAAQQTRSLPPRYGRTIDVPIYVGGEADREACSGTGSVVGLDPKGDGFLSVRSGPGGQPFQEIARIFNGQHVYLCEERGNWFGVVYSTNNSDPSGCRVMNSIQPRVPYTGPCRYGWISKRYVRITSG